MPLKCPFIVGFVQENDLYRVRLTEVSAECRFILQSMLGKFWDFSWCPLNRGCPLNTGSAINTGCTVARTEGKHVYIIDH